MLSQLWLLHRSSRFGRITVFWVVNKIAPRCAPKNAQPCYINSATNLNTATTALCPPYHSAEPDFQKWPVFQVMHFNPTCFWKTESSSHFILVLTTKVRFSPREWECVWGDVGRWRRWLAAKEDDGGFTSCSPGATSTSTAAIATYTTMYFFYYYRKYFCYMLVHIRLHKFWHHLDIWEKIKSGDLKTMIGYTRQCIAMMWHSHRLCHLRIGSEISCDHVTTCVTSQSSGYSATVYMGGGAIWTGRSLSIPLWQLGHILFHALP